MQPTNDTEGQIMNMVLLYSWNNEIE